MMGESKEQVEAREKAINTLLAALEATYIKNITHWKSRTALAIALYEMGYRMPSDNERNTALSVVIEAIKSKGVLASLNSKFASPEVKARSDKGIFISFEQLQEIEITAQKASKR